MNRASAYRELAITPVEAVSILQLDWPTYLRSVRSDLIALSLDLCVLRPSVFKAHSFWDVIEFRFRMILVSYSEIKEVVSRKITTELLDEIAETIEISRENDWDGSWSQFESDLVAILRSSILTGSPIIVRRVVDEWAELERKFLELLEPKNAIALDPCQQSAEVRRFSASQVLME